MTTTTTTLEHHENSNNNNIRTSWQQQHNNKFTSTCSFSEHKKIEIIFFVAFYDKKSLICEF